MKKLSEDQKVYASQLHEEVVAVLENLIKNYRSLLDVVRKERDLLIMGKLDDLVENNKIKDGLIVRLRSLENHRMKCSRDLAHLIGVDANPPRLLDLATRCLVEYEDTFRQLHSTLEFIIKRVADLNKKNEDLVQSALSSITGSMESIRSNFQFKPVYARDGAFHGGSAGGNLVEKEA